ncbi:MAG TPA: hypothetical protein VGH20_05910 [Myxococcales bacterium]|jgi:hypothetical protein
MRRAAAVLSLLFASAASAADNFAILARAQPSKPWSEAALRNLFLGATRSWPGGRQVEVGLPAADTPEMEWLAKRIFHLPAREVRTIIRQRVFTGEMGEPRSIASAEDCLAFARESRGGLCVIDQAAAAGRAANTGLLTVQ